jgi:hypothetical protein
MENSKSLSHWAAAAYDAIFFSGPDVVGKNGDSTPFM